MVPSAPEPPRGRPRSRSPAVTTRGPSAPESSRRSPERARALPKRRRGEPKSSERARTLPGGRRAVPSEPEGQRTRPRRGARRAPRRPPLLPAPGGGNGRTRSKGPEPRCAQPAGTLEDFWGEEGNRHPIWRPPREVRGRVAIATAPLPSAVKTPARGVSHD